MQTPSRHKSGRAQALSQHWRKTHLEGDDIGASIGIFPDAWAVTDRSDSRGTGGQLANMFLEDLGNVACLLNLKSKLCRAFIILASQYSR